MSTENEDNMKSLIVRFRRAVRTLNKIRSEAEKVYPQANYYLEEDNLHLMKGPSHDSSLNCEAQHENSIAMEYMPRSGGGGW